MAFSGNKISRKQAQAEAVAQADHVVYFAGRMQVYPKAIKGMVRQFKWAILVLCLVVYYALPMLRWHREHGRPDQAVLVDLAHERLYFFNIELWPQEMYILGGLVILAVVSLFLISSLIGRVWCGYSCPQTVWTDLFMLVERKIEGDRNERIKRDRAPMSFDKAWRKTAKHIAWIAIAFLTGGAWITYFVDAPVFVRQFWTGAASVETYFFTFLFTALTYLLAGWAREQVCTFMCPWPRFQAAMFDDQTYTVTYETQRGEPRAKGKKDFKEENAGDCIDCGQCVAVCPTGIDIRDGNQLECIGCGLCIDACNEIMDKVGRPKWLITWDTTVGQEAKKQGRKASVKLIRARTLLYLMILLIGATFVATAFLTRPHIGLDAQRDRAPFFVMLDHGVVLNGYSISIVNKTQNDEDFDLSLGQFDGALIKTLGTEQKAGAVTHIKVPPDTVGTYRVQVLSPPHSNIGSQPLDFILKDTKSGEQGLDHSMFMGPLSISGNGN